jgi:hypothetical protein
MTPTLITFLRNIMPFHECPRYSKCSVSHCPLDPHCHLREDLLDEENCTLPKSYRTRIAAKYPELLPWGGLWASEARAKARWDALSPAEQEALRERGRALAAARKAQNGSICPFPKPEAPRQG